MAISSSPSSSAPLLINIIISKRNRFVYIFDNPKHMNRVHYFLRANNDSSIYIDRERKREIESACVTCELPHRESNRAP